MVIQIKYKIPGDIEPGLGMGGTEAQDLVQSFNTNGLRRHPLRHAFLISSVIRGPYAPRVGAFMSEPSAVSESQANVQMQWGVRIPLRDGICLNGTLYLPLDHREPTPVILTLTPYVSQTYHHFAMYFAAGGLPFLTVDVRGRGNSQGEFRPTVQEAADGYDVVEWVARQSYCNGKVTMWGGSYAGYDQWAVAKEMPTHLETIVPVAAAYMGVDFPMRNNMLGCYLMQWLTYVSGRTAQDRIFWDNRFWKRMFAQSYEAGAPFADLDARVGNPSWIFQEWISHPEQDEYWDRYNPSAEQYSRMRLPILTITGSYDDDQLGALMHYREHVRHAAETARDRHYLVIGPWDHAGTRVPRREFDGVKVGPASLLDLGKLHLEWYAWTMQGGRKPEFLQKRVAYYVMGAERWRYADTLEAITERIEPYYLRASSNPTDLSHSGCLGPEAPPRATPSHYVYDPRDVSGAQLQNSIDMSYTDQRLLHHWGGRRLFFESAPFEQDTEISGFFKLRVWLAIDQADTDFEVTVYEVGADGSSLWLTSDCVRARYRESLRRATLVRTPDPLLYEFERFTFMSRVLQRGARLRLVIGPADSIHLQRNFNSGGVVARESIRDARPVQVRLFHDPEHPSALYVPIGRPCSSHEPSAPAACLLSAGQSAAGEGIYA